MAAEWRDALGTGDGTGSKDGGDDAADTGGDELDSSPVVSTTIRTARMMKTMTRRMKRRTNHQQHGPVGHDRCRSIPVDRLATVADFATVDVGSDVAVVAAAGLAAWAAAAVAEVVVEADKTRVVSIVLYQAGCCIAVVFPAGHGTRRTSCGTPVTCNGSI